MTKRHSRKPKTKTTDKKPKTETTDKKPKNAPPDGERRSTVKNLINAAHLFMSALTPIMKSIGRYKFGLTGLVFLTMIMMAAGEEDVVIIDGETQEGYVRLCFRYAGETAGFLVTDTGQGMTMDVVAYLMKLAGCGHANGGPVNGFVKCLKEVSDAMLFIGPNGTPTKLISQIPWDKCVEGGEWDVMLRS